MGSSSIIGYTIFQNTTRSPEVRPLVYLSLSDLFLGLCWLTGALFYSREASHPTREGTICYNLQATGQIFYVASFLYTVNYTWQLYTDLKGKFHQHLHGQMPQMLSYSTHLGRIAILFSSLIPIFLMAPVLGLGNHFQCSQNFTAEHGYDNLNTTLLIRARMLYKRFVNSMGYVGDQQWAMLKVVEQAVALYPMVFFCCWGPAFILGIVKLARTDNASVYMTLYVLEALTASSQGFLNCVVYGWTQHMFHCVKRKACRDVDTQTPLLRSQKRFYASTLPAHPQAVAEPSFPSTTTVL
ncbi:Transmembrane protein, partial [Ophiophagus hannah]